MLKVENAATPFTAATVTVPASAPPAGLVPIATVIVPVKLATTAFEASRAETCTAGEIVEPDWVLLGCVVKARCVAGGGGAAVILNVALVALVRPEPLATNV